MWFRRKKDRPESEREQRPPIRFRADDLALKRAENMWLSLGFANDRFGAIPALAGYLAMYRDWDRAAAEKGVPYLKVKLPETETTQHEDLSP